MISSARSSSDCGIVRPSAFAAFMLMTSSNFVACSTGRSAGWAPRRTLSNTDKTRTARLPVRTQQILKGRCTPGRLSLVLEEHVRVAPAGADAVERRDPARQIVIAVLDGAEAQVAEVRGGDLRRRAFLGIGDAERRVARAEQRVHLVVEPALVAELEGRAEPVRQDRQELAQPIGRLLEVRGELKEQRAELVAERARGGAEVAQRLVDGAEPGEMCDPLRRLEDVREARGGRRGPARDRLLVRHPIERRVDLDGRETLDVVGEHLRGRKLLGVEGPPPLRVVVARRPDVGLQPSTAARGVGGSPSDSATPGCTTFPPQTLTPLASAGLARTAATAPRPASSMTYGSVAFVSAKVDVRGTSAGMLATP